MMRPRWLLPTLAIISACTASGSTKAYRPQSSPEFRTAAASIMGKDVNHSVPEDPDNPNPRIRLQPSPGKVPLIGDRSGEVLASNPKSGAYVAFIAQVPVTQYFQVMRRVDCDGWIYLQQMLVKHKDDYKSGNYAGDKPALMCANKIHSRFRKKSDDRLKDSDGVLFDPETAKFADQDGLELGLRKFRMDGWAIKFTDPTPADIEARLATRPLSPIDKAQFKTAAYWIEKHRDPAFAPVLRKLLPLASRDSALHSWDEPEHAVLRALVVSEPADASVDPYLQIMEAGIARMLVPGSLNAVPAPKVGQAPFLAANVLVCRNKPGTLEFLEKIMLRATVYQHKLAAAKALFALGSTELLRKNLASGELGNLSQKVVDMLAGRDLLPMTCPIK